MVATFPPVWPVHPAAALLLAGALPLFLGALFSTWAYARTMVIQWLNFAAWLNAGALLWSGLALLAGVIALFGAGTAQRRAALLPLLLLAVTWVVGFVNALIYARDGWGAMPLGLILSAVVAVLALVTVWAGTGPVAWRHARSGVAR